MSKIAVFWRTKLRRQIFYVSFRNLTLWPVDSGITFYKLWAKLCDANSPFALQYNPTLGAILYFLSEIARKGYF